MNLNNSKMTALYKEHVKLNAKIVPFAGYLMPINYSEGIKHEYNSVREDVGIFDGSITCAAAADYCPCPGGSAPWGCTSPSAAPSPRCPGSA